MENFPAGYSDDQRESLFAFISGKSFFRIAFMKKTLFLLLIAIASTILSYAQTPELKQKTINAINKIAFLKGKWEGTFKFFSNGQLQATANLTDEVVAKVNNTIIEIYGSVGKMQNDTSVHQALVIISYDANKDKYIMKEYSDGGKQIDGETRLVDDHTLQHNFNDREWGYQKITIMVQNNKWKEITEMSKDGKKWDKIIEEELERK
jgi:hypothetical protein